MTKHSSISRRRFAGLIGAGTAYAFARPIISHAGIGLATNARAASMASVPTTVVRLNSNENPYGPSPMAIKAMTDAFSLAWRYPDEHADVLIDTIAKQNGVKSDQIVLGDGSGEILKICASAFTGPMTNDNRAVELARPTR